MAARAMRAHSDMVGMATPSAGSPTGIGGVEDEVSPPSGSATVDVTEALFEIVPLVAVTSVCREMVAFDPLLIVPRLQVTVVVPLQVPCDGVAEMSCRPAGSVSVTTTPVAADGPAFVTVIV
jgi:hypothetical protein